MTVPLVITLAVSALGLAAAGGAVYHGVRTGKAAQQVVNGYFTALEERRFDDAYLLLSPDTRAGHSRDALESAVAGRPPAAHELTGELRVNRMPRGTTGAVGVSVTYADGTNEARKIPMVRHDGDWLVSRFPY